MSLIWLEQHQRALPSPTSPRWHTDPLVIIDAGHGGHDGGAVANDIIEKEMALDLAKRVQRDLAASGVRVVMTRSADVFLPLEERAAFAAKHGAAAFISVHLNTDGEGGSAEGIETYFAAQKPLSSRQMETASKAEAPQGEELAAIVQRAVCMKTKAENRGTKARSYAVVSQAACPAVLVECGFITSTAESARLKRESYRDQVAGGIAQGVALFLQTQPLQTPLIATAAK